MDPPSPLATRNLDDLSEPIRKYASAQTVPAEFGNPIGEVDSVKSDRSVPASLHHYTMDGNKFIHRNVGYGKHKQDIVLTEQYIKRHPTIKTEVNWFYRFVSFMKRIKVLFFDNGVDFFDELYAKFWKLALMKMLLDYYESNKNRKYVGLLLQTIKCVLNTRTVILLPLFPVGIVMYSRKHDIAAVLCLIFALMYFAKLLSNTTEALESHVGPLFSSLLNATFGNLVELIISGTTVAKDDATLTITSLLGSVISNNLLVVGSCFLFGGLDGEEIGSTRTIANHMCFLVAVTLFLSLMSVVSVIDTGKSMKFKMDTSQIGASFMLLAYVVYLIVSTNQEFKEIKSKKEMILADPEAKSEVIELEEKDEEEEAPPPVIVCLITLAIATAGLGPCANFFVESLKELTDDKPISKVFIGLVILPLAGSLPEHFSSLIAAHRDHMDLAVSLSIGSSNQVLGMVLPIIQFISSHYPKTGFSLYIAPYAAGYLFASTFVLVTCITHALIFKVNVLHATLLLACYGFIVYLSFAN